jgi:hypothetical protein
MLTPSAVIRFAGVGLQQGRSWGLVLAAAMSVLVAGLGRLETIKSPYGAHDHVFTIVLALSLVAIVAIAAILPTTWVRFQRESVKSS